MSDHASPYDNVTFLDDAVVDMVRINKRSPAVAMEALRLLKRLDRGDLTPIPLRDFAKTGNLTDCGKIIVALEGEVEHRIVVRDVGGGRFEVSEVITVEARTDDLAYLLAGLRLGRIDDPVRRSDTQRRVARIQRAFEERNPEERNP